MCFLGDHCNLLVQVGYIPLILNIIVTYRHYFNLSALFLDIFRLDSSLIPLEPKHISLVTLYIPYIFHNADEYSSQLTIILNFVMYIAKEAPTPRLMESNLLSQFMKHHGSEKKYIKIENCLTEIMNYYVENNRQEMLNYLDEHGLKLYLIKVLMNPQRGDHFIRKIGLGLNSLERD